MQIRSSRSFRFVRLAAVLCTGLLSLCNLAVPAGAQLVANCQTTSAPSLFPFVADETSIDPLNGWAADTDLPTATATFAVGDIDGDGNDELVSLPAYTDLALARSGEVKVAVSRWIQTGWTPMAPITYAMLMKNLIIPASLLSVVNTPSLVTRLYEYEVHLADVNGDGQKEVVVRLMGTLTNTAATPPSVNSFDQEQIYHYDAPTKTWTFVTSYATGGTSSMWMKANTTDKQEVRITLDNSGALPRLTAATLSNNRFNTTSYSPIQIQTEKFATGCGHGMGLKGYCIAFGDVTGDGLADLVYVGNDPNYNHYLVPSITGKPLGGTEIPAQLQIHQPLNDQLVNWQVGDIDGSGVSALLIPNGTNGFSVSYWNSNVNGFSGISDPGVELDQTALVLGPFTGLQILPKPIVTRNYDQNGANPTNGPTMGVAVIGKAGTYILKFTSSGGQHTFPGVYDFSNVPQLTTAISGNAGFAPTAYSGYFRFAVEGQNVVMLARSASGIVNMVQNGTTFVDPNTLTDRGYPAYTTKSLMAHTSTSASTLPKTLISVRFIRTPRHPGATFNTRLKPWPPPYLFRHNHCGLPARPKTDCR